jgi:hypothetical protein
MYCYCNVLDSKSKPPLKTLTVTDYINFIIWVYTSTFTKTKSATSDFTSNSAEAALANYQDVLMQVESFFNRGEETNLS